MKTPGTHSNTKSWPLMDVPGELGSNEIHVWRVCLDAFAHTGHIPSKILSPDEIDRARRFHFHQDQKRYILCRLKLRQLLGQYLEKDPHTLEFTYSSYGKPMLARDNNAPNLCFNISHSGDVALFAITLNRNIGVDIEQERHDVDIDQVAPRFFSPSEMASLERNAPEYKTKAFFQYWTRKEAFIKALGQGLSFPLENCDVTGIDGNDLEPVIGDDPLLQNTGWYVKNVFPGHGYAAAVAAERNDWIILCREFSE